jgi:hypothetical protein
MRSRVPLIVAGAVLALVAIWLAFLRAGGGDAAPPPAEAPTTAAEDPWAKPAAKHTPPPAAAAPQFLRDADPVGALRLEGQVLDADEHGVEGAEVWLASVPPQSTKTGADGSFAFDKLVGRVYELEARKGDDVGGPIAHTLTASSDPAIVRLRHGQTLAVLVTAAGDGKPIADAAVEVRGLVEQRASTGADGKATLHGVATGWIALSVSASGFAPAHVAREIKDGDREVSVQLARGGAVAGKVVDEAGAPVANARVMARDVATIVPLGEASKDGAITAADGTFTIPAVPKGTYRFVASDDAHAPGATEPIELDGETRRDGVTIKLAAAAVLAGHVITKDRQPAPYATIKVAPKDGSAGIAGAEASSRQVVADQDGRFVLRGLPRVALRVRAESDAAASAINDVDLAAAPPADLELVLDVSGTIAGVVVDGDGQPVAEAQVTSIADFMGGGANVEDFSLAGFQGATTDGGGRFAIHGLAPGAYRLWAHRAGGTAQPFDREGTKAQTGDTAVRIVLAAPGGIKGTVVMDDGSPVTAGTAETGATTSAAIVGGAFELRDLAPGKYDVRLHGAQFAELTKREIVVEAGKTTDLGAITVHKGRRVTGVVLDASGAPAAGAKVAIGKMILADGNGLGMGGLATDEQLGLRTTVTGGDGGFALIGVGPDGGQLISDDPARGRSDVATIPPGTDDPPPVTLHLHGFGSLGGKITVGGQPVGGATVNASEHNGGASMTLATTGADGVYYFQKVPEGAYHLTVMRNAGFGAATAGADANVVAGQHTQRDIDIPQGSVSLTVEVHAKPGAEVDAAEVMLVSGNVSVSNGKQLQDVFLHGSGAGSGGVKFWLGGPDFPTFEKLTPGAYSVCVLPVTGNIADPRIQRELEDQADKLAVYCSPATVAASPSAQKVIEVVPGMTPLPPPT